MCVCLHMCALPRIKVYPNGGAFVSYRRNPIKAKTLIDCYGCLAAFFSFNEANTPDTFNMSAAR